MEITGYIWLEEVIEKLARKHRVVPDEVEEVFRNRPKMRRIKRGRIVGEDVYTSSGQTDSCRYLIVFFILKQTGEALILSARDMDAEERRSYGRKQETTA